MSAEKQEVLETILSQKQDPLKRWYSGDPYAYAELMADDVTYFAPNTDGRVDGRSGVKESYAEFAGEVHVPNYKVLNPDIQLSGDLALHTCNLTELDDDGNAMNRWNATEVYRQTNGEWRMIHAHWSVVGGNA